jgi:hypothetical protein
MKGLLLFDFPDRRDITQKIDAFYAQMETESRLSPWQQREQATASGPTESDPTVSVWYMDLLGPALERTAELAWRLRTDNEATLAILGIKHYQATQGTLPVRLEDLPKAGLVSAIPRDYYSEGTFGYQPNGNTFILYSRGEDLKDDGGKPAVNDDGELQRYAAHGDWIYWPVTR